MFLDLTSELELIRKAEYYAPTDFALSIAILAKGDCDHICTSDCRREGCNCDCGEYHKHDDERDWDLEAKDMEIMNEQE